MAGGVPTLPAGMDPRMMMMGMNGPHGAMHTGMRGPYPGVGGPGVFPVGPEGLMGPRMMMGPNGPMPMGGGPPMGYHPLPPNHPIMMEMQALHQHLQQMCAQPQNPANQQKVCTPFNYFVDTKDTVGTFT
jgi:hypothetical protein